MKIENWEWWVKRVPRYTPPREVMLASVQKVFAVSSRYFISFGILSTYSRIIIHVHICLQFYAEKLDGQTQVRTICFSVVVNSLCL